ncbi:hypothetical protein ACSFA0_05385 [Variovorax sp. LT1P1]|uniref:hypothetical protein n=1 Tax=Variovorax sp. LT1P1 TaxID=3443730 RepID=UPI003F47DB32
MVSQLQLELWGERPLTPHTLWSLVEQPPVGEGQQALRKLKFAVEVNRKCCQNVLGGYQPAFQRAWSRSRFALRGTDWIVMLHCVSVSGTRRGLPEGACRAPILIHRHGRA